ncbi:MAG TPA: hypothetical protein PLJ33_02355 [Peptococcaceae bacterium]|jgi:hypothetical protein|nr:hypothetical protein [Clostridia bacterium]HOB81779.1 hypothetical protein [Peptococcaceae bacterium]HPZ71904.1 hypothetical protein [Peptococcaceae bacterium]HQD53684.1 hypothetical protein [Peptococcaceae bacterium]
MRFEDRKKHQTNGIGMREALLIILGMSLLMIWFVANRAKGTLANPDLININEVFILGNQLAVAGYHNEASSRFVRYDYKINGANLFLELRFKVNDKKPQPDFRIVFADDELGKVNKVYLQGSLLGNRLIWERGQNAGKVENNEIVRAPQNPGMDNLNQNPVPLDNLPQPGFDLQFELPEINNLQAKPNMDSNYSVPKLHFKNKTPD